MAEYTIRIMLAGGEDAEFVRGLPKGCIASVVVDIPNSHLLEASKLSTKFVSISNTLRDSVVYTEISNETNGWTLNNKPIPFNTEVN